MIVIVESPYQLQNAISLFQKMELDVGGCRIFVRDNGNFCQKKQLKNHQGSVELTYFYLPSNGVLKVPLLFWFYIKYFLLFFFAEEVTLGDARSIVCRPLLFLSSLMKKNLYLVDDGLYLISHIEQLRSTKCFIYTSLPLKIMETDKFVIIKKNTPKFIKYNKFGSVSFIGQPLVELGFIKDVNFFKHLAYILQCFSNDYNHFDYYAHRYESEEKLNEVKSMGFNVIHLPMSIESYFYYKKAPTGIFISYYSTALLNVLLAHNNSKFYFIDDKLEVKDKLVNNTVMLCYKAFSEAGMKRLNL